jgi:hypothetical protein
MQKELRLAYTITRGCVVGMIRTTRWLTRLIVRLVGNWVLLGRDSLPCPGCHAEVPLNGWFFCEWCQGKFLGHAFAPCPTNGCGAVPSWIPCPRCEHTVNNPAFYGS